MITINGLINIFSLLSISGENSTPTRQAEVEFLKEYQENFKLGAKVEILENDKILFIGTITSLQKNTDLQTYSFVAKDDGFRLAKNNFIKNYNKVSAKAIAKEVCELVGAELGETPTDITPCTFQAIDLSGLDIINKAYKQQSTQAKGTRYTIAAKNGKINIIEVGEIESGVIINSSLDIRTATYAQDIENLINKIIIYKTENEITQIIK